MKLNDKVRFINEKMQGTITAMVDEKTVSVMIDEGFEIPVLKKEIFVVEEQNSKTEKMIISSKTNTGKEKTVQLVFEQQFSTVYKLLLTNNTFENIIYAAYEKKEENFSLISAGEIKPANAANIARLDMTETEQWNEFYFVVFKCDDLLKAEPKANEFSFHYRNTYFKNSEVIKDKKYFFISINELMKKNTFTPFSGKIFIEPELGLKEEKNIVERPQTIVDLHIEKLVHNAENISAEEAVLLQVKTFENEMEKAISMSFEKIIFIHGVGNGTLKLLIRKNLSTNKNIKSFRDAMKEKFGYGATEVFLK